MAGDTRKWWAPIPACPTCNEDADLCPHDQEHAMTSPTQRRHDELVALLTKISEESVSASNVLADVLDLLRDRLPEPVRVPDPDWDCAACGEPAPTWQHECTDVTEEPPVALCGREHDGLHSCKHTEPSPDVDPDEALARAIYDFGRDKRSAEWELVDNISKEVFRHTARVAREHIEADVERLTRERDAAVARAERAELSVDRPLATTERVIRERDDLRARVDDLIRERGQAIERYKALRADVDRYAAQHSFPAPSGVYLSLSQIIHRDDERGRDA